MKVDLNLATRPFGRSRLFWTASAAAGIVLLVSAGLLVSAYATNKDLPPALVEREQRLTAELQQLSQEEALLAATLRDPETIAVYDRSHFLNQLLVRKGISWTRTFSDLEAILPPRVLVMQIRPEVTFDNKVQLEMQVGAETREDFIEFLIALERSELFGPPNPRGYSPPNDNEPYHRFDLTVNYEQRL